jgi:hypothetical protein
MITPDIKKSPYKVFIYYIIGALVLFGIINCIGMINSFSVQSLFFLVLLAYLFAGIIHLFLMKLFFADLNSQKSLLFTILLTFLGIIAVFLLNLFILNKTLHTFYTLGLVLFPLPFLFIYSLQLYLNIPDKIFKKWYYPVDHTMPDLDLLDLSRVLIIQFEFLKSTSETTRTNFKAKAPNNMPFGELFYIFISDYNDSHPQNIIEILNPQQLPYPWIFFIKTPWWKRNKYIDPDLTFQDNGIVNNDIIFCQRVNP